MTWICLRCGNTLCWVHDGGAYCPCCGATDAKYEKERKESTASLE